MISWRMKGFSKNHMEEFKEISLNQLIVMSDAMCSSPLPETSFIRKKYLKNALDFNNAIYFLEKLKCLKVCSANIAVLDKYKRFLGQFKCAKKPEEVVREFFLEQLLLSKNKFSPYISQFISRFSLQEDIYKYTPHISERLRYSNLRNFLVELGALSINHESNTYVLSGEYASRINLDAKRPISPQQQLRELKNKNEIGARAEKVILEYEKSRLSKSPSLRKQIEYTAQKDVIAGYDIKSFELANKLIPRFIEVKAVSCRDYRFLWSRNEIQCAQLHGKRYYLYLVPIGEKSEILKNYIQIIQDPYMSVLKEKNIWERNIELFSFRKKTIAENYDFIIKKRE